MLRSRGLGRVDIEVRGAASFVVAVRARYTRRAFSSAPGSYTCTEASLALPVEPESFFAGDDFDGAELVAPQTIEWIA